MLFFSDGRCCSVCAGSGAVRLAYSEVSGRLYFTDWQAGSISVIDVQQSTSPQPIITGLNEPLPITAHPIHRCVDISVLFVFGQR